MGLAPYGDTGSPNIKKYVEVFKKEMIEIKNDGSLWFNQDYFYFNIRILTKDGIHFIVSISICAKIILSLKCCMLTLKEIIV